MGQPGLILIDSSVWIEGLRADGAAGCRETIDDLLAQERAATCEVVVAEILRGAASEAKLSLLTQGFEGVICLGMVGAGREAGRLSFILRQRGLSIPTADLLITGTARLHGAALLHRDRHIAEAAAAAGVIALEPGAPLS